MNIFSKRTQVDKPGALTLVYLRGEVPLYAQIPTQENALEQFAIDYLEMDDGLVLILSSIDSWRYVLTSSSKLGWVHKFDLGVGMAGSVFYLG